MKNISVKVDEEFHREVKIQAAKEGVTIQDYVIALITKDLESKKVPISAPAESK